MQIRIYKVCMINRTNNISFKGMSAYQIKKFVPTIADKNAENLSHLIDLQINSRDILEVADKNKIQHLMEIGDDYTIMGIFKYNGPDEEQSRVNFIGNVVSKVKYGY